MESWQKRDNPNVIVKAVRLNEDNVVEAGKWCRAMLIEEIDPEHPEETQYGLNVITPKGILRASLGMYIFKFGKFFFVAHIRPFEILYEPVTRKAPPPESIGDTRKALGFADPFEGRRL